MRAAPSAAVAALFVLPALLILAPNSASAQSAEIRTWSVSAAEPGGTPLATSEDYELSLRVGGSFVGYATSASYVLWGCSVMSPVEDVLCASEAEGGHVLLRWCLQPRPGVIGYHIFRSVGPTAGAERVNDDILPPLETAVYEDRTVWPQSTFCYALVAVWASGSEEVLDIPPACVTTGGVLLTRLHPPSPNPSRGNVAFCIDNAQPRGNLRVAIYDVTGRLVNELHRGQAERGRQVFRWNGIDRSGSHVASGVYFCVLDADGERHTCPLVVAR